MQYPPVKLDKTVYLRYSTYDLNLTKYQQKYTVMGQCPSAPPFRGGLSFAA
jgi:hypothetical protein